MAEHWCKEHQIAFFKKGRMKGYAHPILNEDGEPTGEWCNEPKQEETATEKPRVAQRDSSTNDSIESQVAFKGMVELIIADIVKDGKVRNAVIDWAMSRLNLPVAIINIVDKAIKEVSPPSPTEGELEIKTAGDLFKWIMSKDKNIKAPRTWLNTNYNVDPGAVLTTEKIAELHEAIKTGMNW